MYEIEQSICFVGVLIFGFLLSESIVLVGTRHLNPRLKNNPKTVLAHKYCGLIARRSISCMLLFFYRFLNNILISHTHICQGALVV